MADLVIENNGPMIISTNYWSTDLAQRGLIYVSVNAGAFRLLLPRQLEAAVDEMATAEYAVVTRGTWYAEGTYPRRDAFELMLEDGSDAPYSMHVVREQVDRIPTADDEGRTDLLFLVYTEGPALRLKFPARYRRAKRIPFLRAWE